MKKIFKKKRLDFSKYVNTETGETLISEHPNITSLNSYNENLTIIDYNTYVMTATTSFAYLKANFNRAELARITELSHLMKGSFNMIHADDNTPHTDESLMIALDYTRNKYHDFMKKLLMKGVIYYVIGYTNKVPVKYILLNPYLARKTKAIHNDCLQYFHKLELTK